MSERLFGAQRQERLLAELRGHGAVRVRDLARDLGVSELTIRRDIAALAARGLVSKVHGGATLPAHRPAATPSRRPTVRFNLGMVVPSLDFYWPPVVAGARAAAAALGVDIQLRGSGDGPEEEVHGLLLAGDAQDDGPAPPTVHIERQPRSAHRPAEWVCTDHTHGVELAVDHLRGQGHHRIGLVLTRTSPTSAHLLRAWRSLAEEGGAWFVTPGHREQVQEVVRECRRTGVTALIAHSDPQAVSIARHCAELGLAVPTDLALVSYDDEVAHLAEPALTAIRPPKTHIGRLAVELMVARLLGGPRRPAHRVLLAPDLVIRASSITHS